ncbi:MAG TPA: VOC family protein [Candidatus Limnocylindria bacterium]|jgi:catechol 2,3-dioxygenase-like lactoylglutathione lyase family enzyme|nr:VOC family protein [Candidatus Limnocylindria bacterium]
MAVADATAIKGIDITTYLVQDGERAKAFYRDKLGLKLTGDYGPQGGEFALNDGTTFGLWKMRDGSFRPSGGVMFAVDDVKGAVDRYAARGVVFDDGGAIEETPNCYMAFGTDSEGNAFILHQRKT